MEGVRKLAHTVVQLLSTTDNLERAGSSWKSQTDWSVLRRCWSRLNPWLVEWAVPTTRVLPGRHSPPEVDDSPSLRLVRHQAFLTIACVQMDVNSP